MHDSFQPKVDVFMPLYIGQYLRDTAHLDAVKSGAYLHLLMHLWVSPGLPADPVELATIAKCTPDAWSIAKHTVMQFFFLGPDGLYHQKANDRIKADWMAKRQKAHEKAQKAANARWRKHREKISEGAAKNSDAPSIARAMPYIGKEQVQKQKQPPPTPSAARRGIDQAGHHAPSIPNALSIAVAPSIRGALSTGGGKQNETKAKPPKSPRRALAGTANDRKVHQGDARSKAVHHAVTAGHLKNGLNPDSRHEAFAGEVLRFWKGVNPEHPTYALSIPDLRALRDLLAHHQDLTITEFRRLLKNRARSEINPAAAPHKWLRAILEYSAGPLGKYGRRLLADAPRAL